MKINFKGGNTMTRLNKAITRYILAILLISSAGYVKSKTEWGLSARQGERPTMEDRHTVKTLNKKLTFFGVYDGHAGTNAADYTKDHLAENFSKFNWWNLFQIREQAETIGKRLIDNFNKTDKDFLNNLKFKHDRSGTTAVVAVVDTNTNKVTIANCGDSRAILIRNGRVLLATNDHKPKLPKERKRIEEAGGFVHYDRVCGVLAVSRAIGDRDLKDKGVIPNPDIYKKDAKKGDILILACDGVWDVMNNEEVAAFIHEKFNKSNKEQMHSSTQNTGEETVEETGDNLVRRVARELRDKAYNKKSNDNISVLIVKFGEVDQERQRQKDTNASLMARLFKSKKVFLGLGAVAILYSLYHFFA